MTDDARRPLLPPRGVAAYLSAIRAFCRADPPHGIPWWRKGDTWCHRVFNDPLSPDPVLTQLRILSRLWKPQPPALLAAFVEEALAELPSGPTGTRHRCLVTAEAPWHARMDGSMARGTSATIEQYAGEYKIQMEDVPIQVRFTPRG